MTVRVRFAPSPTGYLHIGGARTALFNWMFARKHEGGVFILRIEDTDQKRFVEGSVENITNSLRWLGLDWDEGPDVGGDYGPYTQSERTDLYREWAEYLLANDMAYRCFCTPERLAELRAEQERTKAAVRGYDRRCRNLSPSEIEEKLAAGIPYVIRFKAPLEGTTTFTDEIRGDIEYPNAQIPDQVLLKSDGFPTYHLANVVDDHFMQITHIMRGDEWISTAPLHVCLYEAFGWDMPAIGHMPVILSPSGKGKLSKREKAFQDGEFNVLVQVHDYESEGYLPEAVVNWLANVGWSFGDDVEKFTMAEALPRFEMSAITPSPTKLPFSKLGWLNGQYIQEMDAPTLAAAVKPYLEAQGWEVNVDSLLPVMAAMSTRLKRLPEAVEFLRFLFDDDAAQPDPARLTHKKMGREAAMGAFVQARSVLENAPFDYDSLSSALMEVGEAATENGKAGPFLGTLRYGMTGQKVSPPLFESMLAMGRERSVARISEIVELLEKG